MAFEAFTVKRAWDASANDLGLRAGRGSNGDAYLVSVAGATNIGQAGNWVVGDIAVFVLDRWVRIAGTIDLGAYALLTDLAPYALKAGTLAQFAATTSAQLKALISDETGSAALVFANAPDLINPTVTTQAAANSSTLAASTAMVQAALAANLGVRSLKFTPFSAGGTFTPDPKMVFGIAEGWGGGGGGGGCAAPGASVSASAGGGGSGAKSLLVFTPADIGASKAVTIGAAGAVGAAGNNNGGAGGTTSLGAILTAPGGGGGGGSAGSGIAIAGAGGTGGVGSTVGFGAPGGPGVSTGSGIVTSGAGGNTDLGGGGPAVASSGSGAGVAGVANRGGGGSGASVTNPGGAAAGGLGGSGYLRIFEFLTP